MAKPKKYDDSKLNLFKDMIPAATTGDLFFYRNADDEGRKEIEKNFWMLHRMMSQIPKYNSYYVLALNELVNHEWSALTKHPELRWMLFAMAGAGERGYYKKDAAVGHPNAGRKLNKIDALIEELNPDVNDDEIAMIRDMHTDEELRELAMQYGVNDDRIKDVFGK